MEVTVTYISWSRDFALYLWQYLSERHHMGHLSKQQVRQVVRGQPFKSNLFWLGVWGGVWGGRGGRDVSQHILLYFNHKNALLQWTPSLTLSKENLMLTGHNWKISYTWTSANRVFYKCMLAQAINVHLVFQANVTFLLCHIAAKILSIIHNMGKIP